MSIEQVVAFTCGFVFCYCIFRSFRTFIILAFCALSICHVGAQTNLSYVVNWPYDTVQFTNSVPVTLVDDSSSDYSVIFMSGFFFAVVVFSAAWKLSAIRKFTDF